MCGDANGRIGTREDTSIAVENVSNSIASGTVSSQLGMSLILCYTSCKCVLNGRIIPNGENHSRVILWYHMKKN